MEGIGNFTNTLCSPIQETRIVSLAPMDLQIEYVCMCVYMYITIPSG